MNEVTALYSPEITSISGEIARKRKFRRLKRNYMKIVDPVPYINKDSDKYTDFFVNHS